MTSIPSLNFNLNKKLDKLATDTNLINYHICEGWLT